MLLTERLKCVKLCTILITLEDIQNLNDVTGDAPRRRMLERIEKSKQILKKYCVHYGSPSLSSLSLKDLQPVSDEAT
ncbi:unnamed protein product [Haemonchus placei]|uniref:BAG domain-containing protein n=1 Tax=Haemonchus placei TaxID=6290 RepID=A0A0N4WKN0_HAEPC|nr:unnamed protein product [Haemonchus placei]